MSEYSFETYGELEPWIGREWLQTNGSGAFSAGTIVGANTRRYHGLLVAATLPPVGRIVSLSRMNESISRDGRDPIGLGISQFRDVLLPRGDMHLQRFTHSVTTCWEYRDGDLRLGKELLLCHGRNVVGIRYAIDPGAVPLELRLQPFVALRDFHGLGRADHTIDAHCADGGCVVRRWGHGLHLRCDGATFNEHHDWWYNFTYRLETERGQDDTEDLFTPGIFTVKVEAPTTLIFWAGLESVADCDWQVELDKRTRNTPGASAPTPAQQRLTRAAADFVVGRRADEFAGATILAGYPWFSDWGRDTMIALPGLLLATGRFKEASQVLCLFARFVSEGMIPNVFDDYHHRPYYNTVDASLWFVNACFEYRNRSKDNDTFDQLLRPACAEIIGGYRGGTRFGIKMDSVDSLITQGDPASQLTWMDAKTNGVVFTPRHGKAVEINALWYNALRLMDEHGTADKVQRSFREAFWISPYRGLADVINETGRNEQCRPNQIFAVSLAHSPLTAEQQAGVVEVVRRELLTPKGLRTLSPSDPKFQPRYAGNQFDRDKAYHNGTIWPWLIGAFLDAHLKVNNRSKQSVEQARRWLTPLLDALENEGCVGQIAEICEAQPPHRSVGAFAQAWSVAEVLRLAVELEM
ncbi:MAG TPA: amylo-alpha-1,6-glucosidase [Tepidisphaeraceae bacterium]|jgi:predicted glycogen debranching enzyme